MNINPEEISAKDRYKLLIGSVIPRPIAFVSTKGQDGTLNLAPFSFYNVVCFNPMIVAFFPIRFKKGSEIKDTVRNIRDTGKFVINVATEELAEKITQASGLYDYGRDEFAITGLNTVASKVINVPGVAESPIRMECRLEKIISFGDEEGGSDGIFGRVVNYFADDDLIDNFRIDERKLNPLARLAGNRYSLLGETFDIARPNLDD